MYVGAAQEDSTCAAGVPVALSPQIGVCQGELFTSDYTNIASFTVCPSNGIHVVAV